MSTYTDIRYDYNLPSGFGGSLNLISEQTASSSASLSFTSGIDSSYRTYMFKFINMHSGTDNINFTFNFSTDGGSNYNVTKTSTFFRALHDENDSASVLQYDDQDLAQGTGYQILTQGSGIDNDQSCSGYLYLFNPSNTTYVKHFISTMNNYGNSANDFSRNTFIAGYGNTVSPINSVRFQMSSGNIDDGTIKMYGIA
jgi:hypothetical protein